MKTFPTLYKRSSTGAIQRWDIEVELQRMANKYGVAGDVGVIVTRHGQLEGKIQEGYDIVYDGKNAGKANATTAVQQAENEAQAKHEKQKKKGYVESIEAARAGEVDAVIEGGILPMLAPSKIYPHFAHKLNWPVYVQPKLDGMRCIAIYENGTTTLWSRTRKRILSVPHIADAVTRRFQGRTDKIILDGELYADQYSADFEELMSLCRRDEPDADGKHLQVEYWIYDLIPQSDPQQAFGSRNFDLVVMMDIRDDDGPILIVDTTVAQDESQVYAYHAKNLEAGFEGSMVRNNGPYEGGRRSMHLQKLKNFQDLEYPILDAEEGRGKDAGTVGAFVCCVASGAKFRCRLKASYARRRELFEHPEQWRNMGLTVRFQNLSADGIPRFPTGKSIRDYE